MAVPGGLPIVSWLGFLNLRKLSFRPNPGKRNRYRLLLRLSERSRGLFWKAFLSVCDDSATYFWIAVRRRDNSIKGSIEVSVLTLLTPEICYFEPSVWRKERGFHGCLQCSVSISRCRFVNLSPNSETGKTLIKTGQQESIAENLNKKGIAGWISQLPKERGWFVLVADGKFFFNHRNIIIRSILSLKSVKKSMQNSPLGLSHGVIESQSVTTEAEKNWGRISQDECFPNQNRSNGMELNNNVFKISCAIKCCGQEQEFLGMTMAQQETLEDCCEATFGAWS